VKIGYVLSRFPVLSQTFIINEIIELIETGHEVTIFSLTRPRSNLSHPEVSKYRLAERVYYLPVIGRMAPDVQDPPAWLASLSCQVYGGDTPVAKLLDKICLATAVHYFAKLAAKLELDILHSHFYGIASAITALIAGEAQLPFTFTCHAVDIFVDPDPKILRCHMDAASRVITVSEYNKDYLKRLTGVDENKIVVVRACLAINKFESVKRQERSNSILSVCRLVRKKGLHYALLAISQLVREFPRLRYRIIGDGPEKKELMPMVKSLGLERHVEFLGSMGGDQAFLDHLSEASFMLLPCIQTENGDLDVCPLVLQEAMCAQVPVLSTNISAIPELVENGKQGLIIPPNDVQQLVTAMKTLLLDQDLRKKMGKAGHEKIEQKFNIHKEVSRLLSVWREITGIDSRGVNEASRSLAIL
jgi:glycosyltransferase involved in cell wall biosynthesis